MALGSPPPGGPPPPVEGAHRLRPITLEQVIQGWLWGVFQGAAEAAQGQINAASLALRAVLPFRARNGVV